MSSPISLPKWVLLVETVLQSAETSLKETRVSGVELLRNEFAETLLSGPLMIIVCFL